MICPGSIRDALSGLAVGNHAAADAGEHGHRLFRKRSCGNSRTLESLARAPSEQVMQLWAGLGYYSRARNLHKSARICQAEHGGELPESFEALMALPGIGRSTAGAILSQAHGQAYAIMDGNVKRVLTRFHAVSGDVSSAPVLKQLWQLAESHLPKNRLADYTQALMDLGATLCTRSRPDCLHCPLADIARLFSSMPLPIIQTENAAKPFRSAKPTP